MTFNITFWLILALIASVTANFFAFWYIRVLLGKLMYVGDNLADLVTLVGNYKKHLKGVHSMEMYYGDETLKFLMGHTNSLLELLEDYEDVYTMTEIIEEPEEINKEEIEDAKETIAEENVFYAGSRTSNNRIL